VPILDDQAGLDRAYAEPSGLYLDGAGTLFVAGSRGNLLGRDWRELRDDGPPAARPERGDRHAVQIEANQRYKTLEKYMQDHPGTVKNMVGHSKGAAAVDIYKKNTPDFTGKARIYSTPYEDVLGREKLKDVKNEYQGAIERRRCRGTGTRRRSGWKTGSPSSSRAAWASTASRG
jgi:hypothetical protein